jgi:curved DNA-binding protein CbpA
LPWLDNVIHTTEEYSAHHLVTKLDPMGRYPILNKMIHPGPTTVQVLLASSNVPEEDIYSSVHLMVMAGLIYFDKNKKIQETTGQEERLQRIKKDLEGKNHFEVLGIGKNSKATDSKRAYFEFAKAFHPDKLPPNALPQVRLLTTEIFNKMSAAYEVLKDEKSRTEYLRQLDQGQAAQVLQADSLMEEGRALIKSNQATKALAKFKEASFIRPPTSDMKLHTMWARINLLSQSANEQEDLLDVRRQLDRIPPEDRHTAMYYFVKALFQKTVGEMELAKSNLKQCLILDINFKEAQRELNMLNLAGQNKGGGDIFNKDLTTVIGSLFKKSKK